MLLGLASRLPAQSGPLTVSPTQLTFDVTSGGSPVTQNLVVVPNSGANVNFTATAFPAGTWLSIAPASGTTPQVVTVTATPGSLNAGTYGGFVTVSSGTNSTTVPVILNVNSSGTPAFTATPGNLTYNFQTGATVPVSQQLSISGPQSTTFTATASTNDGGTWLTVNPTSAITPGNLTVSVNPSSLAGGVYFGAVAINAPGTTGLVVPVQVNIASQGALNISPQQISFVYQIGTTAPGEQTIAITTTGTSPISFTATSTSQQCGGNWLVVSPQSGAAPATLSVQVNTTGLTQSTTCAGTITIAAPSAANSSISIPVSLLVSTNPLLQVPTADVTFDYQVGTVTPASQTVQVTSSSTPLPFTVAAAPVSNGPNFLTVTPASGTTPQAITLAINSAVLTGLAPNTYAETVTVSSASAGNPSQSFTVTLVVTNNPTLITSQTEVTFNYQIGQAAPPKQTLTLTSAGAPLTYTVATSASTCPGFLSVTPTSGTTSTDSTQPTQVVLSVKTTGLTSPQTCNGQVTLSVPGSGNAPETIPVKLNVSNTPLLNVSPAVLNVTALAGTATPVQQTISLTSTDNATALNFTATAITNPAGLTWLSVTPNTGTTPASLNITVNAANLPAGTYTGHIHVSSSTANVLPQNIPVTLIVASGTIVVGPATLNFTQAAGGSNPASQTVTVTGVPAGATVGATATSFGASFLTATTSGTTVTISANGSQLSQGTYSGIVTIFAPGAMNSPFYVPVTLTVSASGGTNIFTPSPTALSFAFTTGGTLPANQTIQLAGTAGGNIAFNAVAVAPPGSTSNVVFVSVTPSSGTTPGALTVSLNQSVVSTLAAGTYTNEINLTSTSAAGVTQSIPVTLTVAAAGPPTIAAIVNGGSFQAGAISPGEVVSIFGTNIGPATADGLQLTSTGTVETTLSNTFVTFNGVKAPLIFVSLNQVNAVVPYEVSGTQTVPVIVNTNGTASAAVTATVVNTAPALFTLSLNGTGQGAILNGNSSVNGTSLPAAAGSPIVIYATGEGVTTPASITGSVTPSTGAISSFPTPFNQPVTVTIGGQTATVLYAGEAPGLIAGVLQVNTVIPVGTPSGNQPVIVTVGGVSTPTGVTVAVQ